MIWIQELFSRSPAAWWRAGRLGASVETDRHNLTVGTSARLMCRVTGDDDSDVTIQWRKDGELIATDNDEDRYTFDGPSLNIDRVIGQDSGQYTCTAVRGDEEATSPEITLNIHRELTNHVALDKRVRQDARVTRHQNHNFTTATPDQDSIDDIDSYFDVYTLCLKKCTM